MQSRFISSRATPSLTQRCSMAPLAEIPSISPMHSVSGIVGRTVAPRVASAVSPTSSTIVRRYSANPTRPFHFMIRRGYSTQETTESKQNNETEKETETKKEGEAAEAPEEEVELSPEQKRIKELEEETANLKNDYLRSLADKQNLMRICKQDVENAKLYGIKNFAQSMIEVADNLERALEALPEDQRKEFPVVQSFYEGIQMTERIMLQNLEKYGMKKFVPVGEKFDPAFHEALCEVEDDTKPAGTVAWVQQSGFTIHNRLIRPARVGVVKNTKQQQPKAEQETQQQANP